MIIWLTALHAQHQVGEDFTPFSALSLGELHTSSGSTLWIFQPASVTPLLRTDDESGANFWCCLWVSPIPSHGENSRTFSNCVVHSHRREIGVAGLLQSRPAFRGLRIASGQHSSCDYCPERVESCISMCRNTTSIVHFTFFQLSGFVPTRPELTGHGQ